MSLLLPRFLLYQLSVSASACGLLYHIFTVLNAHPACYVSHAYFLQADMRLLPTPYYAIMVIRIMTHVKVLHPHLSSLLTYVIPLQLWWER